MCARNTVCAECALKMVSDHTIPIRNWSLIRPKSDHCQTIVQPWPRRNPDHCPDDCARQMTSDQIIPRPKMPLIRPSSKHFPTTSRPLSRRLCAPDDLWSDSPLFQIHLCDERVPFLLLMTEEHLIKNSKTQTLMRKVSPKRTIGPCKKYIKNQNMRPKNMEDASELYYNSDQQ